jgi:hypothetical protein
MKKITTLALAVLLAGCTYTTEYYEQQEGERDLSHAPLRPQVIVTSPEIPTRTTIRGNPGADSEVHIYPPICDPYNPPIVQGWQADGDQGDPPRGAYQLYPEQIKYQVAMDLETGDSTCLFGLVGLRPHENYWVTLIW